MGGAGSAGPGRARFRVPGPAGKLSRRGRPLPGWRRGAELRFTCPPYQRRRQRREGQGGAPQLPRGLRPSPPPSLLGAWRRPPRTPQPPAPCQPRAALPDSERLLGRCSETCEAAAARGGCSSRPPRELPSRLAAAAVTGTGSPCAAWSGVRWPPGLFLTRAGRTSSSIPPGPSGRNHPGASLFKPSGPFSRSSETSQYIHHHKQPPPPPTSPAAGTGGARSRHSGRAGTPAPGPCSWARGAGRVCLLLCAEIAEEKMGFRSSGPGAATPRPLPSSTFSVR